MRYLLLFALSISYAYADFKSNDYLRSNLRARAPNMELHMEKSREFRSKRDIRIHQLSDPDSCCRNCSRRMNEGLQNVSDAASEEAASKQLCLALGPVEQCYKECPDSKFRTLLLDFLPTLKVPCLLGPDKYPEMKKSLDCLNRTDSPISAKCDPVCNASLGGDLPVESRILLNVNPPFIMYDDNKKENTDMLRATCRYLSCEEQCGDPIEKAQCGQMAVDLDRKITASVFGSVIKLYMDMDALDSDIPECKPLM